MAAAPLAAIAQSGMPHGNHDPHHGGVVLMYGMDLHFEIVLRAAGVVRIYLTDGQRVDLPASYASDLALEIERPDNESETVAMAIGKTGESWEGKSAPIDAANATLHLAFIFHGNPIVMSLPAASLMTGDEKGTGERAAGEKVSRPTGKDAAPRGQ